jgi:hypothetical protein
MRTMTAQSLSLLRAAAFSALLAGINGFSAGPHRRSSYGGLWTDIKFKSMSPPRLQTIQLNSVSDSLRTPFFMSEKEAGAGKEQGEKAVKKISISTIEPPTISTATSPQSSSVPTETVPLCIVGGGVSGLTAAIKASEKAKGDTKGKVILLEGTETLGGRVQSDKTEDGYVLDRGFAVFIEEYPVAKAMLDYDALQLGKFLPGALVKVKGRIPLAKVADPLRQPASLLDAVIAPIGSLVDKIALLPLIFTVRTKSVQDLFKEAETDTFTALTKKWKMSDVILGRFFRPFLEGRWCSYFFGLVFIHTVLTLALFSFVLFHICKEYTWLLSKNSLH